MSYVYFNELMYDWRYVCVCMCMSVVCLRDGCIFCVTFPALAFSYLFEQNSILKFTELHKIIPKDQKDQSRLKTAQRTKSKATFYGIASAILASCTQQNFAFTYLLFININIQFSELCNNPYQFYLLFIYIHFLFSILGRTSNYFSFRCLVPVYVLVYLDGWS